MPTENHVKRILIVRNPRSGAGDKKQLLDQLANALVSEDFQVQTEDSLECLQEMASESDFSRRFQAIVSAGGDGTASAVATRVPANVPIVLFPLGTENLLARWAGMKAEIPSTIAAIKQMKTRGIDAASANGKLSLIMIGIGYDAEVVHQVHSNRKGHITKWTYGWPMFYSAFNYAFPNLRIQAIDWKSVEPNPDFPEPKRPSFEYWSNDRPCYKRQQNTNSAIEPAIPTDGGLPSEEAVPMDLAAEFGGKIQWTAKWLFIANLPTYAGGMSVVPNACADDGYLCAASFRSGYPAHGLWYVANIYLGSQSRLDDFRCIRAKKYRVVSDSPARFQVDGDDGGSLPVEISVLPHRVTLVLPADSFDR